MLSTGGTGDQRRLIIFYDPLRCKTDNYLEFNVVHSQPSKLES